MKYCKNVYLKDIFNVKVFLQKTLSKFLKVSLQKTLFSVNFSKLLKVSLKNTLLKSIFPGDTFHVEKITLHLGIFLN